MVFDGNTTSAFNGGAISFTGGGALNVSWTASTSSDASGYNVYRLDPATGAIKLVANIKVPPSRPTPSQIDAFKAAIDPLKEILGGTGAPEDFQWLGICQMVTGNEKEAAELFRTGLKIERDRNPQSDLCGSLMKWVAAV